MPGKSLCCKLHSTVHCKAIAACAALLTASKRTEPLVVAVLLISFSSECASHKQTSEVKTLFLLKVEIQRLLNQQKMKQDKVCQRSITLIRFLK